MKTILALIIEIVLQKIIEAISAGVATYRKNKEKLANYKKNKEEAKKQQEAYEKSSIDNASTEFERMP